MNPEDPYTMLDLTAIKKAPPAKDRTPRRQAKTYLSEPARLKLRMAAAYAGVPEYLLIEKLILEQLPKMRMNT